MPTALIAKLERFTRLSTDDKAVLMRIASERVRVFGPHEDIINEGDAPEDVNLMLSGWAFRHKQLEDGRRQIIAFFLPGDLCDHNVFILREMDHSISTLTQVRIAAISRERFDDLTLASPRLIHALWWESLVTSAIQREWTVNLGQRNATERMAHLFCEVFLRMQSIGLAQDSTCDFPLTQVELADVTGLSSVHVNRTLQELRHLRLIELKSKRLKVLDLPGLMRISLFNTNYLHFDYDGRSLDANV